MKLFEKILGEYRYKKPKCDCGRILEIKEVKHYRERFNAFTWPLKLVPKFLLVIAIERNFLCSYCQKSFEIDGDKYGRAIKGGLLNKRNL